MPKLDLSQFSAGQIVLAFFIVFTVMIALGTVLPKVIATGKNIWNSLLSIVIQQEKKKQMNRQIDTNTKNISALTQKIDSMADTLNCFIDENKKTNQTIIQQLEEFREEQLHKQLDDMRAFVLNFANLLKTRPEVKHTVKEYLNVIDIGTKYHAIIEEKGLENGAFDVEFEFIKRDYRKRSDERDFLNMEEDINDETNGSK